MIRILLAVSFLAATTSGFAQQYSEWGAEASRYGNVEPWADGSAPPATAFLWTGNRKWTSAEREPWALACSGVGSYGWGTSGRGVYVNAGGNYFAHWGDRSDCDFELNDEFTIATIVNSWATTTELGYFFCKWNSLASGQSGWGIGRTETAGSPAKAFYGWQASGTSWYGCYTTNGIAVDNGWHTLIMRRKSGVGLTLYLDGGVAQNNASAGYMNSIATVNNLTIGGRGTGGYGEPTSAALTFFQVIRRAISDREVQLYSAYMRTWQANY